MNTEVSPGPASGDPKSVRTTCPYCGVGCGVDVSGDADGVIEIHGDRKHPANFGRLCSKGTALAETLDLDDRLLYPMVDGERADWDTALDAVGARFRQVIEQHGPDVIVLDILMPDIDGREVCRRLREAENWTPVIMLTQISATGEKISSLEEGVASV